MVDLNKPQILYSIIAKDNIILVDNKNMHINDPLMKLLKDSLKEVKKELLAI